MNSTTKFVRPQADIHLRKRIKLFTEGEKTEPAYFNYLNLNFGPVFMNPIKRHSGPAPTQVLKDVREHFKNYDIPEIDEYWIVLDVDKWTKKQKQEVENWCNECPRRNFLAVSNPCFELWLILHFEENPPQFKKSQGCKRYYVDNYGGIKEIEDFNIILVNHVKNAMTRAEKRDVSGDSRWPENSGTTTVYKLVKKYFEG